MITYKNYKQMLVPNTVLLEGLGQNLKNLSWEIGSSSFRQAQDGKGGSDQSTEAGDIKTARAGEPGKGA